MTPKQEKQKKRIEKAQKEYIAALNEHECFIPEQKEKDEWGCYGLAVCTICRKNFGWYCPTSPDKLCNYDPPGNSDDCNYCHQPDERK